MLNNFQHDVSIIQLCLPHYRVPFFARLTKELSGRLSIVAGPHSFGGSPVSLSETPGICRVDVHNFFFGSPNLFFGDQLVIQHPLPANVFSSTVTVLEFNPRILSNLWILVQRKQMGRPVILWGHGLSPRPDSPRWVKKIRQRMGQFADALIFYNDKGKRDFMDLGFSQDKLFVAHNAIDVRRTRQLASKHTAERKHVLFVGRLIAAKKVDLLIEAFAKVLDNLPTQTKLIIIGDGPERTKLFAQAEGAGISSRVEFVGEIIDDELLAPYFARSMLAVSPGYIGLFAIHSLAYGVPMLVADDEPHSPEVEALTEGQNCEFFSACDSDALAEKLKALSAQPDRLSVMGQAGVKDVTAKHSLQHMSNVFLRAFNYVLS